MTPTQRQAYEHERIMLDESLKWIHPEDAIAATILWLQRNNAIPEAARARLHELTAPHAPAKPEPAAAPAEVKP